MTTTAEPIPAGPRAALPEPVRDHHGSRRDRACPSRRALLLVGHGSPDPRSGTTLAGLAGRVRLMAPEMDVRLAFLEHAQPLLEQAADSLTGPATIVPLLLGAAYHATADLPVRAEAHVADLQVTAPLGPDPLLDAAVGRRVGALAAAGVDGLLVVATGSSWARADAEAVRQAEVSSAATGLPATAAFASRAGSVHAALERLEADGARRVGLVPWMLAEGRLLDRALAEAGERLAVRADPLAVGDDLVPLVLARYAAAERRHTHSA